ncbi:hypothetical protein [Mucilaginibacter rubeus]|uniref:Novel STAND NTPase 5 domain-containing protein n=1 Tax=Mucilaginibacter rubeus TaxID=2027860 RepID=A0A5C1I560_9SPHI|nr:hypothetical protein [Mucilaginibacter rubeus]QEM12974.1 hypothetical protein DEO27_024160 [Mucilaginibacter rubeus]
MAKQRSSRELYKAGYLNELREKVINKYLDDVKSRDKIVLKFNRDKRSKVYVGLNLVFEKKIGQVFDGDTLIRFFHRTLDKNGNEMPLKENRWFEKTTIDLFEKYLLVSIEEDTGRYFLRNGKIAGCEVIDREFVSKAKKNTFNHDVEDFYLAKQKNDCQWVGIANDWACPRPVIKQVINQIKESFAWEPPISALIHGLGGVGKTTFLRQMTVACINEGFVVLWIISLESFLKDDLKNIISNLKYILILDDLSAYLARQERIEDLFEKVGHFNNVKVVVSDRVSEHPNIRKYLLGNNFFELTSRDNVEIINKILFFKKSWQPIVDGFSYNEIYSTSIFKILFIIIKESEDQTRTFTKGIHGRFVDIIEHDLVRLNIFFPGLSKALYHLGCLYCFHNQTFTWKALIKLAIHYSGGSNAQIVDFDLSNPSCKVLNRYFSLEHFLMPYYEDDQIIYFHHGILLSDGLCKVHLDELYFNNNDILLEIIDVFHKCDEPELAYDILNIHYYSDEPSGDIAKDNYFQEIRNTVPFFDVLTKNHTLERLLKEASVPQTESFWRGRLGSILHIFENTPIYYQREILALLIASGCEGICVLQTYHYSEEIESLIPALRDKFKQSLIIAYNGTLPGHLNLLFEVRACVMDLYTERPPFWYFTLDMFDIF